MGMYTGLRFKGIVKEEYRDVFENIAYRGEWYDSEIPIFHEFGEIDRASFIPTGMLCFMPDCWENDNGTATDGFERFYDEETGYWSFQCSLKNYSYTIQKFFNLIPKFIESVEHCEKYYEEWEYSLSYDLVDGMMVCMDSEFIRYW